MYTARLLLVDDDRDNLEVLTVMLLETYRVWSYCGAAEALAALEAVRPDLVVLDIGMRPVDGLQCLEAIRARPGYGRVPAIALTAFARDVDRKAFLAAGFETVVTKPVLDHRELLAVIASLLTSAAAPGHALPAAVLTAPANGGKIAANGSGKPSTSGPA
jgi:CheY-like chemotaxis protein